MLRAARASQLLPEARHGHDNDEVETFSASYPFPAMRTSYPTPSRLSPPPHTRRFDHDFPHSIVL